MRSDENGIRLRIRDMIKLRGDGKSEIRIEIPEFSLKRGEFVAVLGSNGSGKSTLLDMLGLILSPNSVGEFALIAGRPTVDLRQPSRKLQIMLRRHHFAYVLQTGGLLEFLNIRQNMRLAARLSCKPLSKVEDVGRMLDIENVMGKYPGKVSGGQRQKAAIARALVQDPEIILADEPTAAMDTPSAKKLIETFRRLALDADTSVVMATHDYELVRGSADRFYHFRIGGSVNRGHFSVLVSGPPQAFWGSGSEVLRVPLH